MSIVVPDQSTSSPQVDGAGGDSLPPRPRTVARSSPTSSGAAVRVGRIDLGPAAAYLLGWTLALFAAQVLVLWTAYAALDRLGVLDAVSRTTATVLGDPVPVSGVLPVLEFDALLPWVLTAAAVLAALCLLTALSVVLVHNAVCALTGGPRVHVR